MRLVYKDTQKEVKVGDICKLKDGTECMVNYYRKPQSPASSGKVTVQFGEDRFNTMEYYVGVIGAEWIEREDRM